MRRAHQDSRRHGRRHLQPTTRPSREVPRGVLGDCGAAVKRCPLCDGPPELLPPHPILRIFGASALECVDCGYKYAQQPSDAGMTTAAVGDKEDILARLPTIKRPGCTGVGQFADGTHAPCGTADPEKCQLALCATCFGAFSKHWRPTGA